MSETTLSNAFEGADEPDLTQPDEFSDVTLVVEGRKLYTSKAVLVSASPVWRRMFTSDFKEKNSDEISLPGKSFNDILQLLLCITPATNNDITGDTVFRILPLAEEYQMKRLKRHCEQYLRQELNVFLNNDEKVKYANLARTYGLGELLKESTQALSKLRFDALKKCKEYPDIAPDTMVLVHQQRVVALEGKLRRLRNEASCISCGCWCNVTHWDCSAELKMKRNTFRQLSDLD